jgi:hypothetical protein
MYAQLLAILFLVLKETIVCVQLGVLFSYCMSGYREGEAAATGLVHPEQRFLSN